MYPNKFQPRKIFDEDSLSDLEKSIKERGIIQPIIVRKSDESSKYEIIAGERRWRASQLAKIHEIPSIIRDDVEDEKIAELSLVENIQRSELNPIEEAEGYQSLINKYNYKKIYFVIYICIQYIYNIDAPFGCSNLPPK